MACQETFRKIIKALQTWQRYQKNRKALEHLQSPQCYIRDSIYSANNACTYKIIQNWLKIYKCTETENELVSPSLHKKRQTGRVKRAGYG